MTVAAFTSIEIGAFRFLCEEWALPAETDAMLTVQTKGDLLKALAADHARIRGFGVKRLGLFGSFVRGSPALESDVDLLVEFEDGQKTFDNFMQLSFFLEELLSRRVELVTRDALSPHIGPQILREVEYVPLSA